MASPLRVIVEARVLNAPKADSVSPPAVTARFPAEVSRMTGPVAPPAVFWTVRTPPRSSGFVTIVYVTPAAAVVSNVTAPPNSLPAWAPKVIVWAAPERNVIGATKDHEADVDVSVQDPVTVHAPPAFATEPVAAETLTFPLTVTRRTPN